MNQALVKTQNYLTEIPNMLTGNKVLLVTSSSFISRGHADNISKQLGQLSPAVELTICQPIKANPELTLLNQLYEEHYKTHFTDVIALGGGSVIDSAKALSYTLLNLHVSLAQALNNAALTDPDHLNLICIPTTSGTGSEVTPFATIWDSESQTKLSLNGVCADHIIHDPTLTLTLPKTETLYSALDALSHALESIWNVNRTPSTQDIAEQSIALICKWLPVALTEPENLTARENLQYGALLAGLAISQTKTALAHAISYPLTLKFSMPHGLACSFTLAALLKHVKSDELKLSTKLADSIINLLHSLNLIDYVNQYATNDQVINAIKGQLDPSRAGNFILPINDDMLKNILIESLMH